MSIVHHIYRVVGGYFRSRRLHWLKTEFADCRRVIDLGGRIEMWRATDFGEHTVIVNLEPEPDSVPPQFTYVHGDARNTGLPDEAFDLAFSNSVIEHVGSFEDQKRFADEMLRIGKRVYLPDAKPALPCRAAFSGTMRALAATKMVQPFCRSVSDAAWLEIPSNPRGIGRLDQFHSLADAR